MLNCRRLLASGSPECETVVKVCHRVLQGVKLSSTFDLWSSDAGPADPRTRWSHPRNTDSLGEPNTCALRVAPASPWRFLIYDCQRVVAPGGGGCSGGAGES